MRGKVLIAVLLLIIAPAYLSNAEISNENGISIKGEARVLTKPDVAYFFLKVDGNGESFELSGKKANEKISQLKEILQTVLGETPEITNIKTTNQPKGKSFDDVYQKDFITGMAKAIKGENLDDLDKKAEKTKEIVTSVNIFFSSENFSKEKILKLRALLTEKEIGFDKNNPYYSFMPDVFDPNLSIIVFGLKNPDVHLDTLAAQAFIKAQKKALTLSGDPERLSIKFSKTFEFELK